MTSLPTQPTPAPTSAPTPTADTTDLSDLITAINQIAADAFILARSCYDRGGDRILPGIADELMIQMSKIEQITRTPADAA